jgi:hypothetical protein
MANHKRKGPKSTRSGCLMCKPQKLNANKTARRMRARRLWQRHGDQGLPSRHEERA